MVGLVGLEPTTPCSQSRCATNCATARYCRIIVGNGLPVEVRRLLMRLVIPIRSPYLCDMRILIDARMMGPETSRGIGRYTEELVRALLELAPEHRYVLVTRTAAHQLVERRLMLSTGAVSLHAATRGQAMHFDGSVLSTVFGPKWRLLLIGAGQLSQAVARMAQMLDFEVLVCDPREEYAATLQMSEVTRVPGMPDDVVRALVPDAHTAIVALTHDPKLDDMALLEALHSNAFYVGALGSRRNQAARKQRLAEHFGVSADALARLHGPVGLPLGAKTPAEIAVSIVAQIVQVKNATAVATAGATAAQFSSCAATFTLP